MHYALLIFDLSPGTLKLFNRYIFSEMHTLESLSSQSNFCIARLEPTGVVALGCDYSLYVVPCFDRRIDKGGSERP
jgi:hypothetical protein